MNHPVLLYDGQCNLCRAIVQWVAERDKDEVLRFAALQSTPGQQLLAQHSLPPTYLESAVFFEDGRTYLGSDAVLKTLEYVKSPWRNSKVIARVIPKVFRDWGYKRVSNNRSIISKLAGTIDERWEPGPKLRHRFLDYEFPDRTQEELHH